MGWRGGGRGGGGVGAGVSISYVTSTIFHQQYFSHTATVFESCRELNVRMFNVWCAHSWP